MPVEGIDCGQGGGQVQRLHIDSSLVSTGDSRILNRSVVTYELANLLGFPVVPDIEVWNDSLIRPWILGDESCSLDVALSTNGAEIAILDYLGSGYVDRGLHHNVIQDSSGHVWMIDNEHMFRPISDFGPDWERGGISGFLHLWTQPGAVGPWDISSRILQPLLDSTIRTLQNYGLDNFALSNEELRDLKLRIAVLSYFKTLDASWIFWRNYVDDHYKCGV
jgi:hypothetical protein